ncbi:Spc19-domain-containing protein [Epithele typhae]|uniref:Spc19-domain-containing protein n=1 Tax=Epithele typhae TaxID=378194 RepID=UPI00200780C7|nr:Spc19-domain-containing protein [Epithele typhae]KAH9943179.1 Spc19-domain-containing protein [Epithele typhae]
MEKNHPRASRLSVHPRLGPRESIFPGNPSLYQAVDTNATCSPYLSECVMAMEDCCNEAYEAQELIRTGTYDLPRMSKILESDRVFLLVDEGTIRRYKADLTDEIEPQINELISRAEKGLQVLLKKESLLQAKAEAAQSRPSSRAGSNTAGMSKLDVRRLQMLSRQRQKLEDELAELQAEIDEMEFASMKK